MKTPISIIGNLYKNQYFQILIILFLGYITPRLLLFSQSWGHFKYILITLVCLVTLYKPFLGLCAIAFFIPLELALSISEELTAVKIFGGVVFVGWFFNFSLNRERQIYFPPIMILLLIFIGWGAVSFFWAVYPKNVISVTMVLIRFAGFFFLVAQLINTERKLHLLILSNVVGAAISGIIGLYQYFYLGFIITSQRITGLGGVSSYASHFGFSLLLAIFYCSIRYLFARKIFSKIIYLLIFSLILVSALLSNTRATTVGLILCYMVLFLYLLKDKVIAKNSARMIFSLVLFIVCVYVIILLMPSTFSERTRRLPMIGEKKTGGFYDTRLSIWKICLTAIKKNPFIGVGLNNSYLVYAVPNNLFDVDNIYLITWVELGLGGFLILLFFLISLSKDLYLSLRTTQISSLKYQLGLIIFLEFIVILFIGFTWPILQRKYLWFGFSLITAYARLCKLEKKY